MGVVQEGQFGSGTEVSAAGLRLGRVAGQRLGSAAAAVIGPAGNLGGIVRQMPAQVVGYTSRESYLSGETVQFHLNLEVGKPQAAAGTATLTWKLYDWFDYLDPYTPPDDAAGLVLSHGTVAVGHYPMVAGAGQGWPTALSIAMTDGVFNKDRPGVKLRSTIYCLQLSGAPLTKMTLGDKQQGYYNRVFFVVRQAAADPATKTAVVIVPTATLQAYNIYGGQSLYLDSVNAGGPGRAYWVSLDRPVARPLGSGGICDKGEYYEDVMGEHGIWVFLQWMLRGQTDYPCVLLTDSDLHFLPAPLTGYRCAIGIGHNEYWTLAMREHLKAYLAAGGNFANLAGNSLWWQMRYAPGPTGPVPGQATYVAPTGDPAQDRMIVCYKFLDNKKLTTLDPVPDAYRWTINWHRLRDAMTPAQIAAIPAADASLISSAKTQLGTGYEDGSYYAGDGADAEAKVLLASDPLFAGTGLQNGDHLLIGDDDMDVGQYELDGARLDASLHLLADAGRPANFVLLAATMLTPVVPLTQPPTVQDGWTIDWQQDTKTKGGDPATDHYPLAWAIGYFATGSGGTVFSGAAVDWGAAFAPWNNSNVAGWNPAHPWTTGNNFVRMTGNVLKKAWV